MGNNGKNTERFVKERKVRESGQAGQDKECEGTEHNREREVWERVEHEREWEKVKKAKQGT